MSRFLWTPKESFGPPPRADHALAFDSNRNRTVLFGGNPFGAALLGDTWEWDGELWTQTSDIGPGPRSGHAMTFDSTRNVVLLFGGATQQGPQADTWSWDGANWTQLSADGPSARASHALAFDDVRGRAVLFGGVSNAGPTNDTWEWDGQAWTQEENIGPSARGRHAMAYDIVGQHTVLFGGSDAGGNSLGDTWEWDGALWTHTANFGPNPRLNAAMVSTDVQVALFGGATSLAAVPPPGILPDTWSYINKRWTHRQDIGPGPRWGHAMAFDSARRAVVFFGGLASFVAAGGAVPAGQPLGDTWEHTETDPPAALPVPVSSGVPAVASIVVAPTTIAQTQPVSAFITLDQAAPVSGTVVQVGYLPMAAYQSLTNGQGLPAAATPVTLGQLAIVAGSTFGQYSFAAPTESAALAIIAYTDTTAPVAASLVVT
ncbi:MAG TPA: kelch repeat-containing protein [Opitutaceae bacterium]